MLRTFAAVAARPDEVGDVIADYGGADATFEVRWLEPVSSVVFWSQRTGGQRGLIGSVPGPPADVG